MAEALRVGVAGLGTVGTAVLRLLERRADALAEVCGRRIDVVAVSSRSRRDRGVSLDGVRWFGDAVALAADPGVDVVVELIGGEEGVARALVEIALGRGASVVTANKALLARHGVALAKLAEAQGAALAFEAAVAGGVPVVKALRESLVGNRISRVSGILNGTCNYILSRMEAEGLSFEACLAEAQRLGYAEADPTFDIGGFDTAHKLALLTSLAFGTEVDAEAVHIEGIASITTADLVAADELGYRIKLLGVATRTEGGVEQRVHPTMVPKSAPIAQVNGVTNAVAIAADAVPELTLVGPGAGGEATASAVVADLADLARAGLTRGGLAKGIAPKPFGVPASALRPLVRAPMQAHQGGYYIRLSVVDRSGAAAAIANRMAERQISLESIVQRRRPGQPTQAGEPSVPVVLITYATTEAAIRSALGAVMQDGTIVGEPQVIRIERE